MARALDFIDALASDGRHHFTTDEAAVALGTAPPAMRASLRRLKARGLIATPHRGFHVIVPPEYRRLGCLPPEQFVPQLMQLLEAPYYVALLSAAELHGAAPQRPQSFQVMGSGNRRPIRCGQIRVQFCARKDAASTPTALRNTPRGSLRVATPAATALELVGYPGQCGGLEHVAAVLHDLAERLHPTELTDEAERCPIAWVQRLGHLLDRIGHAALAGALQPTVTRRAAVVAPLVRALAITGAPRDERWRLAVNAILELET
ncbi:MAG: type IV toxin-antitoxin system AbiEi family antitoxin [Planctomycetes bacterium]|nr:type IV toxin-antitoxin system AbiEi family antitoxin [Planctomycetota bacterium]